MHIRKVANHQLLDLFRRVAQATGDYAHDYVILGEMLRPPQITVPEIAFDWLDVELTTGDTQIRQMTSPAVLASAWRAPSGHIGYALANITDQEQQFDLPLTADGLAGPYLVYAGRDGEYEMLYEGEELPSAVEVSVVPWGVELVAVVSADSDEAHRVRAQPTPSPTPEATATPYPTPTPAPASGICGGATILPLAMLALLARLAGLGTNPQRHLPAR